MPIKSLKKIRNGLKLQSKPNWTDSWLLLDVSTAFLFCGWIIMNLVVYREKFLCMARRTITLYWSLLILFRLFTHCVNKLLSVLQFCILSNMTTLDTLNSSMGIGQTVRRRYTVYRPTLFHFNRTGCLTFGIHRFIAAAPNLFLLYKIDISMTLANFNKLFL